MTAATARYRRSKSGILILTFTLLSAFSAQASDRTKAELEKEYRSGSMRAVARDAFPVLFDPPMGTVADGDKVIRPHDWVIGISMDGAAKAYPVAVMGFHELINDHLDGHPISIAW